MINFTRWMFCLICLLASSCGDNGREKTLEERERVLAEKEKQFATKQQDYVSLIQMRDSLLAAKRADTIPVHWPANIEGLWSSKLICISSGCSEYVIGDQKTNEIWSFTNDSTRTLVAILNDQKLVRVYHGQYEGSAIELHFKTDSTARRRVNMDVLLEQVSAENIRGTQTVIIDSTCTAKFSVELARIRNN